jgi:hypothetical protein
MISESKRFFFELHACALDYMFRLWAREAAKKRRVGEKN